MESYDSYDGIHRPTRKNAVLFLIFAIVVAAIILAWTFIFNRGSLLISGQAPFSYDVGGKQRECTSSPCGLKLAPNSYTFRAGKDGYKPYESLIKLRRGDLAKEVIDFEFIPQSNARGTLVLPFTGQDGINDLPDSAKNISIAPNNKQLFFSQLNRYILYQLETKKIKRTPYGPQVQLVWGGNNLYVLKKEGGQNILVRWDGKDEMEIVRYRRPFNDPKMLGSPSGKFVVITDTDEENLAAHYIVDLTTKSRKRLPVGPNQKEVLLTDNFVVLQDGAKITAYNFDTFKEYKLETDELGTVVETDPNTLLFVSTGDQESAQSSTIGVSISDLLERTEKDIENNLIANSRLHITEFSIKTNTYKTLISINAEDLIPITRLAKDGENILYERGGELYEVVLEE